MPQAKDRNGMLTLRVKSNAQVSLAGGGSILFSTGLLLQSKKVSSCLLLGNTGLCALTCPLTASGLSLWVMIVFLMEEVVCKETRRARGVLVPLHHGYRQSLKSEGASGEDTGYTLSMTVEGASGPILLFTALRSSPDKLLYPLQKPWALKSSLRG